MNETIRRFGYPETLVAEYDHWLVLLRPAQPTLGSLVLAARGEAIAFSELDPAAFGELSLVVAHIESALRAAVDFSKINYLMLMMVDPNVHFHVIPRYQGSRTHNELTIADAGWPRMPALAEATDLSGDQIQMLREWLQGAWPD